MLVKKVNPEWFPSENKSLKVGETIDMTDAKSLIIGGDAVAIDDSTGAEISAFELYGVVVPEEFEAFKKFQQQKTQERQAEKLKKEQEELQAKVKAQLAAEKKEDAPITSVSADVEGAVTKTKVDATTDWAEMVKFGKELGVYKVGIKKEDLITAINNA